MLSMSIKKYICTSCMQRHVCMYSRSRFKSAYNVCNNLAVNEKKSLGQTPCYLKLRKIRECISLFTKSYVYQTVVFTCPLHCLMHVFYICLIKKRLLYPNFHTNIPRTFQIWSHPVSSYIRWSFRILCTEYLADAIDLWIFYPKQKINRSDPRYVVTFCLLPELVNIAYSFIQNLKTKRLKLRSSV